MSVKRRRVSKGRPRQSVAEPLPNDLYDYADEPPPAEHRQRSTGSPHAFNFERLPVVDDWPSRVPVTDDEIGIFEWYFGDVLDRMFGPAVDPDTSENDLHELPPDGNHKW